MTICQRNDPSSFSGDVFVSEIFDHKEDLRPAWVL